MQPLLADVQAFVGGHYCGRDALTHLLIQARENEGDPRRIAILRVLQLCATGEETADMETTTTHSDKDHVASRPFPWFPRRQQVDDRPCTLTL